MSIDSMRARLAAQRAAETDPATREAYALAERAGFDWYDTESAARRMAEHAGAEVHALKVALRDTLDTFRASMDAKAWGEWVGTSVHGPEVRNDKILAAIATLAAAEGRK